MDEKRERDKEYDKIIQEQAYLWNAQAMRERAEDQAKLQQKEEAKEMLKNTLTQQMIDKKMKILESFMLTEQEAKLNKKLVNSVGLIIE
jgi:hypothetical protein